jgi:hypothetical protein
MHLVLRRQHVTVGGAGSERHEAPDARVISNEYHGVFYAVALINDSYIFGISLCGKLPMNRAVQFIFYTTQNSHSPLANISRAFLRTMPVMTRSGFGAKV